MLVHSLAFRGVPSAVAGRYAIVIFCMALEFYILLCDLFQEMKFLFGQVRIVAVQALTTLAIRSGEPYRLQIYEFLHALALGGVQSQFSELQLSNGEIQGASGTGLSTLISPMLHVLDEMYQGQDDLARYFIFYYDIQITASFLGLL